MNRRTLARGEPLWEQGESATTLGIVEAGSLAIRQRHAVVGVLFPGMVVGEASILALDGPGAHRTASVVAREEATVVVEYPASMVRETFGVGVPRQVLRSLAGQVCRNALLVMCAHPEETAVHTLLLGTIRGMVEAEERLRSVRTWDSFLLTFRTLYALRDATNDVRMQVVVETLEQETIVRASRTLKELFKADDFLACVAQFLDAERTLRSEGRG